MEIEQNLPMTGNELAENGIHRMDISIQLENGSCSSGILKEYTSISFQRLAKMTD